MQVYKTLKRIGLAAFLAWTLAACAFAYIPLVPEYQPVPRSTTSLRDSKGILFEEGELKLDVRVLEVPFEDWLSVQWINPNGNEVSQESQWLNTEPRIQVRIFVLPDDIPLIPGDWRAVASYRGVLLRQFTFNIPPISDDANVDLIPEPGPDTPLTELGTVDGTDVTTLEGEQGTTLAPPEESQGILLEELEPQTPNPGIHIDDQTPITPEDPSPQPSE